MGKAWQPRSDCLFIHLMVRRPARQLGTLAASLMFGPLMRTIVSLA
jgi:hypothetical protein